MPSVLPFLSGGQPPQPPAAAKAKQQSLPQKLMSAFKGGPQQQQEADGDAGGGRVGLTGKLPRGASKVEPGQAMPHVLLPTVQGGRLELGAPTGKWQLLIVYRGKHCPVSKNYLASLQLILDELEELGVEVVAVSGDGRERAESFVEAIKATTEAKEVSFKVAYGLPVGEMRRWGLFVSHPRSPRETDRPFPEPALFLLNPDGEVHAADYSNSPFVRPDLRILLEGIRYIQENDYPVRGTYGLTPPPKERTAF